MFELTSYKEVLYKSNGKTKDKIIVRFGRNEMVKMKDYGREDIWEHLAVGNVHP